ncbi:MAG: hypothetical protein DRJ03_04650 [Chloroflexi bacterium]|nr:MAG: hypothetical protein DRJ03_04650 [Chloroflexota bacterium]
MALDVFGLMEQEAYGQATPGQIANRQAGTGVLGSSYDQSQSHEDALVNLQKAAAEEDMRMLQQSYQHTKGVAGQRIDQAMASTRDAQRLAASELGNLVTQPGQHFTGDVALGWTQNYLAQLTPSAIATGAGERAAGHFAEMKSALSLGVVKDLADLMGG